MNKIQHLDYMVEYRAKFNWKLHNQGHHGYVWTRWKACPTNGSLKWDSLNILIYRHYIALSPLPFPPYGRIGDDKIFTM